MCAGAVQDRFPPRNAQTPRRSTERKLRERNRIRLKMLHGRRRARRDCFFGRESWGLHHSSTSASLNGRSTSAPEHERQGRGAASDHLRHLRLTDRCLCSSRTSCADASTNTPLRGASRRPRSHPRRAPRRSRPEGVYSFINARGSGTG